MTLGPDGSGGAERGSPFVHGSLLLTCLGEIGFEHFEAVRQAINYPLYLGHWAARASHAHPMDICVPGIFPSSRSVICKCLATSRYVTIRAESKNKEEVQVCLE